MTKSTERKVLEWLASGSTGMSSKALAFRAIGIDYIDDDYHPCDPSDFNRCLLLLKVMPELKASLDLMRDITPQWNQIVDHWDELEQIFLDEAGLDWCNSHRASKTFTRMKELGL